MAKHRNSFEAMAQEAAARLDAVRGQGAQLSLLPDEPGPDPVEVGTGKPGRPKGAVGKGSSQLRKWLAERGMRMPEDQLAEIAGLASGDGAMVHAMAQAEQLMAWAYDGAAGEDGQPAPVPCPERRLAVFLQLYAMALRSAEALLPYGTPKAAPEGGDVPLVQLVMPAPGADPAGIARDVTPLSIEGLAPADVRWKMQEKQQVRKGGSDGSDG